MALTTGLLKFSEVADISKVLVAGEKRKKPLNFKWLFNENKNILLISLRVIDVASQEFGCFNFAS
jgi:hypothetical protein